MDSQSTCLYISDAAWAPVDPAVGSKYGRRPQESVGRACYVRAVPTPRFARRDNEKSRSNLVCYLVRHSARASGARPRASAGRVRVLRWRLGQRGCVCDRCYRCLRACSTFCVLPTAALASDFCEGAAMMMPLPRDCRVASTHWVASSWLCYGFGGVCTCSGGEIGS